jgi:hypothetical protein
VTRRQTCSRRRGLQQVEHYPRAEKPWHDRGEYERLGNGIHLDHRIAAPQLAGAQQQRDDREEAEMLNQIAREAAAPAPQGKPAKRDRAATLETGLSRPEEADDIDLVPHLCERIDLPAHAGLGQDPVLPDDAHACHLRAFLQAVRRDGTTL